MAKKQKNEMEKKSNNFFKDLKSELKKVTWPTFKGLVKDTSAVIAIVLIVAAIVFVLDVCFENLNKFGVEGIKSKVATDTENTTEVSENTVESENATDNENISENTANVVANEVTNENAVNTVENSTDASAGENVNK